MCISKSAVFFTPIFRKAGHEKMDGTKSIGAEISAPMLNCFMSTYSTAFYDPGGGSGGGASSG